jgi:hypothetical protein
MKTDPNKELSKREAELAFRALVAEAKQAFEHAGLPEMLRHLENLAERAKLPDARWPFPLMALPDKQGIVHVTLEPQVKVRVTHLVLSPESARAYELLHLSVGHSAQYPGGSRDTKGARQHALPMETFSIEYLVDGRLAEVQGWKTAPASPGVRIELIAQLREPHVPGAPDIPLRGLAWADIFWPL